jgi:hypothetical protein
METNKPRTKWETDQLRRAARLRAAGADWPQIAAKVGAADDDLLRKAVYRSRERIGLTPGLYGFALLTQDWSRHRFHSDEPPADVEVFETRDAAEAAKRGMPSRDDVLRAVVSIDGIVARRQRARDLA